MGPVLECLHLSLLVRVILPQELPGWLVFLFLETLQPEGVPVFLPTVSVMFTPRTLLLSHH